VLNFSPICQTVLFQRCPFWKFRVVGKPEKEILKPVCNKIEQGSNHPLKTTFRQEKHDSKPLLKGRDRETQDRVQQKDFGTYYAVSDFNFRTA